MSMIFLNVFLYHINEYLDSESIMISSFFALIFVLILFRLVTTKLLMNYYSCNECGNLEVSRWKTLFINPFSPFFDFYSDLPKSCSKCGNSLISNKNQNFYLLNRILNLSHMRFMVILSGVFILFVFLYVLMAPYLTF